MTKEELKKEADEYAEGMAKYYASTHEDYIPSQFEKYLRNAYISSAEPREKRIAELESQIEKMKCCPTCDNNKEEHTPEEHYRCKTCKKFCNWELAD